MFPLCELFYHEEPTEKSVKKASRSHQLPSKTSKTPQRYNQKICRNSRALKKLISVNKKIVNTCVMLVAALQICNNTHGMAEKQSNSRKIKSYWEDTIYIFQIFVMFSISFISTQEFYLLHT